MYSLYGNPHGQAAACILNENFFVSDGHKRLETERYGDYLGVNIRYGECALQAVKDWFVENGNPSEIYGFERTYNVQFKN